MFGRVSINIIKLGKIWKIQLVILAYPAFRGQEFKGKRALCCAFDWFCWKRLNLPKIYKKFRNYLIVWVCERVWSLANGATPTIAECGDVVPRGGLCGHHN